MRRRRLQAGDAGRRDFPGAETGRCGRRDYRNELRLYVPQQLVQRDESGPYVWLADQSAGVARKDARHDGQRWPAGWSRSRAGSTSPAASSPAVTSALADGDRIRVVSEEAELAATNASTASRAAVAEPATARRRMMMALVEIRNVTKRYHKGGETITPLDDVSLDVEEGEFVSLMGASGTGKSTLLESGRQHRPAGQRHDRRGWHRHHEAVAHARWPIGGRPTSATSSRRTI